MSPFNDTPVTLQQRICMCSGPSYRGQTLAFNYKLFLLIDPSAVAGDKHVPCHLARVCYTRQVLFAILCSTRTGPGGRSHSCTTYNDFWGEEATEAFGARRV